MAHLFSGVEPFVQFDGGYQVEQICEIIFNLSGALAPLLFSRAEPFVQFW